MKRLLRRSAAVLLRAAVRIAPSDARDWGRAMLGELPHIDNAWGAAAWAVGGAVVLTKRAIASFLIPGRLGAVLAGPGLFGRAVSVRQVAFAVSAVFILGSLLFFAAPPFRQGLRVSLAAWTGLFHTAPTQPSFEALAQQAEARHDAHGLAFAAASAADTGRSAPLAQEAVGIDPQLTWVYAVVALKHPVLPEIRRWSLALKHFDSQNALVPLITATSIDLAGSRSAPEPARGGQ